MLRAAIDLDADATIVSLDGRSAYDTISRAAFLRKLREVAPALVPFVRLWYGQESTYYWWDASGARRRPTEHPSRRRLRAGRRLGPSPVRVCQHDALVAADERLQPSECLAAFLDDVYTL